MYPVKKYLWAHSCVPGAVFKWRLDERIYRRVDMVSPILQTLLTLAEARVVGSQETGLSWE